MKIRVIDRILLGVSGLFCAGGAVYTMCDSLQGFALTKSMMDMLLNGGRTEALIAAVCTVLLVVLGFAAMFCAVQIRKDPKFVKQHTDNGDLNIAVSAIDELVRKCVATHDEIKLTDTSINNGKEGLVIGLQLSLASGVSIPLAVAALQKQMKQYITASTGLDVKDVCVQVDTAEAKDLNASSFVMPDMLGKTPEEEHTEVPSHLNVEAAAREEEETPVSQRIFGADEQPTFVPAPPMQTVEEGAGPETTSNDEETEIQPEASTDLADDLDDELTVIKPIEPVEEVQL